MRKTFIAAGFGLALALGGAGSLLVAQAARPDSGGWHRGGMMGADSTHRHHRGGPERALFRNIALTDAQKAKLDSLHRAMHDNMKGTHDQMRAQFDQLRAARDKGDTATVRSLMTTMHAQMQQAHDQEVAQVRTLLTADQQKQFDANVSDMQAKMAQWEKDHPGEMMMGPGGHHGHDHGDDHDGPPPPPKP